MKVTLYMAISADGFIAKKDGDSDWVSPVDTANFEKAIKEHGCIIVGRKTFDQYQGDIYPIDGVTNIVVTSDKALKSDKPNVYFVAGSVKEIIESIKQKGHDKALLIGGGTTNASFLNANAIDDMILSVHPLILGNGIKLFESEEVDIKLELVSETKLEEGLIQERYKLLK